MTSAYLKDNRPSDHSKNNSSVLYHSLVYDHQNSKEIDQSSRSKNLLSAKHGKTGLKLWDFPKKALASALKKRRTNLLTKPTMLEGLCTTMFKKKTICFTGFPTSFRQTKTLPVTISPVLQAASDLFQQKVKPTPCRGGLEGQAEEGGNDAGRKGSSAGGRQSLSV